MKFLLCASVFAISAATQTVSAQSVRRSLTSPRLISPDAPTPSMNAYEANIPERDIDLFVGKIIRKDGDLVIVYVMSASKISDRTPVYYSCDAKMRPTSVLENMNLAHKACATFQVSQGTALIGDVVMVKYLAPKKNNAQEENPTTETSTPSTPDTSKPSTSETPATSEKTSTPAS